jgi:hypothetical protein
MLKFAMFKVIPISIVWALTLCKYGHSCTIVYIFRKCAAFILQK